MLGPSALRVYALILIAVVVWGVAPVLTKLGLDRGATPQQAVLVVLAADTATVWAAFVTVNGTGAVARLAGLDTQLLGLFVVTGALGTGLGRLAGLIGIDRLGASIHAAVLSVRPLFATALGVTFLREQAGAPTLLGVGVLVVGLVVLERAREHGGGETSGWRRRDLLFPVLAAAAYAVSRVLRRSGLRTDAVTALDAVVVNELVGLSVLGALLLGREGVDVVAAPHESLRYLLASGVCVAAGMVAVFSALAAPAGRVVVVDPLVATVPLFTVGFAAKFLETERITPRVLLGACLAVVGAVLVIW